MIVCLTVLLGFFIGCSMDKPIISMAATGVVTDYQQRSLLEIEWVEIQDLENRILKFYSNRKFPHFSPSHLREHSMSSEQITVTFFEKEGDYVIININHVN